ncbi:MAG: hypothetical protein KDH96_06895 [Candidatus Riesia sp.]|nr:hypothetical protein [Candidatus Riesia sp.]
MHRVALDEDFITSVDLYYGSIQIVFDNGDKYQILDGRINEVDPQKTKRDLMEVLVAAVEFLKANNEDLRSIITWENY